MTRTDTTAARLERERLILDTAQRLGRVTIGDAATIYARVPGERYRTSLLANIAAAGHLRKVAAGMYRITETGRERLRELEADKRARAIEPMVATEPGGPVLQLRLEIGPDGPRVSLVGHAQHLKPGHYLATIASVERVR